MSSINPRACGVSVSARERESYDVVIVAGRSRRTEITGASLSTARIWADSFNRASRRSGRKHRAKVRASDRPVSRSMSMLGVVVTWLDNRRRQIFALGDVMRVWVHGDSPIAREFAEEWAAEYNAEFGHFVRVAVAPLVAAVVA